MSGHTHGSASRLMTLWMLLLLFVGAALGLASCDPVPQTAQQELLAALLVAEGGAGLDAGTIRSALAVAHWALDRRPGRWCDDA